MLTVERVAALSGSATAAATASRKSRIGPRSLYPNRLQLSDALHHIDERGVLLVDRGERGGVRQGVGALQNAEERAQRAGDAVDRLGLAGGDARRRAVVARLADERGGALRNLELSLAGFRASARAARKVRRSLAAASSPISPL